MRLNRLAYAILVALAEMVERAEPRDGTYTRYLGFTWPARHG